jgi:hypothetical protein
MLLFEGKIEIFRVLPGGALKKLWEQEMHSFIKAWVLGIKALWSYDNTLATLDITNTSRAMSATTHRIDGAAGIDTRGIVVGTGVTAVTISDYKLATQIAHGVAAGQLDHKLMVFDALSLVGGTASFVSKRQFENLSGGTISITETGIYGTQATYNFCFVRDVLAAAQDILNTQIIEVRYTMSAAV